MIKIEETEQWQLEGICKKCRRYDYCSKPCTRHKESLKNMVTGMVNSIMPDYISKLSDIYYNQLFN